MGRFEKFYESIMAGEQSDSAIHYAILKSDDPSRKAGSWFYNPDGGSPQFTALPQNIREVLSMMFVIFDPEVDDYVLALDRKFWSNPDEEEKKALAELVRAAKKNRGRPGDGGAEAGKRIASRGTI